MTQELHSIALDMAAVVLKDMPGVEGGDIDIELDYGVDLLFFRYRTHFIETHTCEEWQVMLEGSGSNP